MSAMTNVTNATRATENCNPQPGDRAQEAKNARDTGSTHARSQRGHKLNTDSTSTFKCHSATHALVFRVVAGLRDEQADKGEQHRVGVDVLENQETGVRRVRCGACDVS